MQVSSVDTEQLGRDQATSQCGVNYVRKAFFLRQPQWQQGSGRDEPEW